MLGNGWAARTLGDVLRMQKKGKTKLRKCPPAASMVPKKREPVTAAQSFGCPISIIPSPQCSTP